MSKITNPTTEPSVTCGFFNSVVVDNKSDRLYNAEQMSAIFDGLINDGVFASIGDKLIVTAGSGNTVNVGTGKCWFNHTWTINDAPLSIDCGAPDSNRTRIDAIVIEVNANDDKRDNFIKVIHGTASQYNPVKPKLTTSERVNQHALCYITRKPGAAEITQANIANAVGTNETPFVTGIVQVTSLDKLLGQWSQELDDFIAAGETKLDNFITTEEADFNTWYAEMKQMMADVAVELDTWTESEKDAIMTWFNEIKGKLSEDPALNLQIQIDANEVERLLTEGLPDGIKTISDDGTVIKTVDSKGRALVKTFTDNFMTATSVLTNREIKNYIPYPYVLFGNKKTYEMNGVIFTDNGDGSITVNGTSTRQNGFDFFGINYVYESGTLKLAEVPKGVYNFSGCPIGGSSTTYSLDIIFLKNTSEVKHIVDRGEYNVLNFDVSKLDYDSCEIGIKIYAGATINNQTFKPKLMPPISELGRLVKKFSADGKTIETTLTNHSDAVPNLVEIERGLDTIIATENTYIGGDNT